MRIRLICPEGGVLEACWEGKSALTGGIFVVSALSKAATCVSAATGMTMGTLVILRIPFSPYHPGGLAGAEKRASQVLGGRRRDFDGVPGRLGAKRSAQPARAVPICLHAGNPANNAWSSTLCDGERPITRGLGGRERAVAPKRAASGEHRCRESEIPGEGPAMLDRIDSPAELGAPSARRVDPDR